MRAVFTPQGSPDGVAAPTAEGRKTAGDKTVAPAQPRRLGLRGVVFAGLAVSLVVGGYKVLQRSGTADRSRAEQPPADSITHQGVTLQRIEELARYRDLDTALVQARLWQERLRDGQAGADDPRLARLAEILTRLEAQALREPAAAADEDALEALLRKASAAIESADLAAARGALRQAEALLGKSPQQLQPYSRRLSDLQARLRRQQRVEQVRQWLDGIPGALLHDQVTAALEAEARAKFLTLCLAPPLSKAEFDEFDAKVRQLDPQLRLARGRRAVRQAQRSEEAGDHGARNRQVRQALAWLPGLPESQVKSYLWEIRRWADELERERSLPPAARPPVSAVGQELELQSKYESLLESFAQGNSAEVINGCQALVRSLLRAGEQSQKIHRGMEAWLCDLWEWELAEPPADAEAEALRATSAEKLLRIRQAASALGAWSDSRWEKIEQAASKTP
jgi:hypothetical protein